MASFFYHNMMTKNFCFGHTLIIYLGFLILLCCQKLIHLEKNRIFLNFSGGGVFGYSSKFSNFARFRVI